MTNQYKVVAKYGFLTFVAMIALPMLAVAFINADGGMIISLFLLYIVNPIYSVITGIIAEKSI